MHKIDQPAYEKNHSTDSSSDSWGREWTRTGLVIRQKPSLISEKSAPLTNIFHSPVGLFVGNTTEISNHSRHDN
jgi:hypothetical protein